MILYIIDKMVKKILEWREDYLNKIDWENKKVQNKWKNFSNRFWKKNLLDLFKSEQWKTNKISAKAIFYNNIQTKIKKQKNLLYFTTKTYKGLESLFLSFCDFYEEYQKRIAETLVSDHNLNKSRNDIQLKLKQTFLNKKSMLRSEERAYMDITDSWDVVAPWSKMDDN